MTLDDESFEADSFETEDGGFVPAVFARSLDEAEAYGELLNDHDIPARIGADEEIKDANGGEHRDADRRGMTHGVPVLVPENLLDEASEVIADREDFAEFEDDDEREEDEDDDDEAFGLEELDGEDEAFLDDEDEEEDEEAIFDDADDLDEMDEEEEGEY